MPENADATWWQQFLSNGALGALTGIITAFWGMAGMRGRISVLETKEVATSARANKLEDAINMRTAKVDDTITALADSQRVAWEKTQQQIWQIRADMAYLPTATQMVNLLNQSKEDILAAIRHRRGEE